MITDRADPALKPFYFDLRIDLDGKIRICLKMEEMHGTQEKRRHPPHSVKLCF